MKSEVEKLNEINGPKIGFATCLKWWRHFGGRLLQRLVFPALCRSLVPATKMRPQLARRVSRWLFRREWRIRVISALWLTCVLPVSILFWLLNRAVALFLAALLMLLSTWPGRPAISWVKVYRVLCRHGD